MIKCIIFDCDGTLIDSEHLNHLAMEIKLRELGIKETAATLMAQFRGQQLAKIIKYIEHKYNIVLEENFVCDYRILNKTLFDQQLKPIDGIAQVLERVTYPMCVASGGPKQKIEHALTVTKLRHYFNEKLFSSYDIGSWKPKPGLFLHAADQMDVEPENCMVVEDSLVGIQAALGAKMKPVLYDPSGLAEPQKRVMTIKHMKELERILLP